MNAITDSIAINHSGWDDIGEYGDIQLYDATLVVDTPKLKKGTKVDVVAFLFSKSQYEIYKKLGKGPTSVEIVDKFPLKLVVA
jgi:hypothetical protein